LRLGDTVIFIGLHLHGAAEHPAIVTRLWSDLQPIGVESVCVNLTVFPDTDTAPVVRSAVQLYATRAAAEHARSGGAASCGVAFTR